MKPITFKHLLFVFLAASFSISCEKNPVAPQQPTSGHGNVSYFAKASGTGTGSKASLKSVTISADVPVVWSSATIFVEKIAFTGSSGNLVDTTIVVEKNLNIFSGDALAGVLKLPAASYKDVKVKLYLRKSPKSELAFDIRGTFTNTQGGKDSLIVASSLPFEANLAVNDIVINPSDNYKATFNFELNKILTGISASMLQDTPYHTTPNGVRIYAIWKGGSQDVPLYAQVTTNWQSVASAVISKQ